ncbi:hypothetical protein ACLOJK_024550 [Asimina triloba]
MLRKGSCLQKAGGNALMTAIPQLLHSLFSLKHHQLQHRQPSVAMHQSSDNLDAVFQQKRALRSKIRKDLKAMSPEQKREEDIAIQNIVLEAPWFKSSSRLCAYISCDALREVQTSKILSEVLSDPTGEPHTQIMRKLYVPRVEDKNSYMRMLNISSIEDLIANSMNILEPAPTDADGNQREDVQNHCCAFITKILFAIIVRSACHIHHLNLLPSLWRLVDLGMQYLMIDQFMNATEPVDLVLIPGLGFDRSGRRLGRAGGYYDAFLKKYQDLAEEKKWKKPFLVALAYSLQIIDDNVIPITPKDIPVDALVCPTGVIPVSSVALERM